MFKKFSKGFTLIEILLVLAIIAILAGIVIVAVRPAENIRDASNASRLSDMNKILSSLNQMVIEEGGDLTVFRPPTGPVLEKTFTEGTDLFCGLGSAAAMDPYEVTCPIAKGCTGSGVDVGGITDSDGRKIVPDYVSEMPIDSSLAGNLNDTGYLIALVEGSSRFNVCAPAYLDDAGDREPRVLTQ